MIRRGFTPNVARKTALLICGILVTPIFFASVAPGLWTAVLLVALAASAHQGFSANIYTVVSDTVPKAGVSSVTGIGGMAGAVGGMIFAKLIGFILDLTHKNYFIPFAICSLAYLAAVLILQLILPRLEPMEIGDGPRGFEVAGGKEN
jgi:ACS family hexuronate transporter-like MFS transporter